jgi:hypothetical protein
MVDVKLTLTYLGQLPATQRGVSDAKARLRRTFHPQIREQIGHMLGGPSARHVTSEVDGWQFISPAHERFRTAVELDVLLLTRQGGRPLGDTDNRTKTLIDGLTRPANNQQLQSFADPEDGGPTYCLLDDDALVNRMTIDSRHWFHPAAEPDQALVVVTASIVPGKNIGLDAPTGSMFLML